MIVAASQTRDGSAHAAGPGSNGLVRWEERGASDGGVLMVTTAWPTPTQPARGIFVKRQVDGLAAAGVPIDVLHIAGYKSKRAYLAAVRELASSGTRRRRYRLIHAQSGEAAAVAWLRRDLPLVITYFGSDVLAKRDAEGTTVAVSRVKARILRGTAAAARATITQSDEMHRCLSKRVRGRDHVLLNGVDLGRFRPRDRTAARTELGWRAEGHVAIFVAAQPDTPGKRLWLAEEAVAIAQRTVPDLRLKVISDASPDEVPLMMAAADCLLHPSASEGSPNVVKEAMACNLPVAATPVGDIPYLLKGVVGSMVCDPDPDSLAAGILHCLHAGHSNGRSRASRFDHDLIVDELIALYQAVAPSDRDSR